MNEASETDAPARAASGPSMETAITLLFGIAGLALAFRQLHDNSFLWHLRTGRWILDHGIPYGDPYSFTASGTRWIAQSWLAELLYGGLHRWTGILSVRLAVGLAGAVIAALLFRIALDAAQNRVRALAITIPALAACVTTWSERPLIFGLALFAVLVFTVEVPGSRLGRHPRIVIPVVMWLWINVHGSFALGFAYLFLHLLGRWLEGAPPNRGRERDLLVGVAIAAVAVFVNPYGPRLVLFPVALLGRGKVLKDVEEWQSVDFKEATGILFACWFFITVVLLARSRPGRRDLLITVVFFWMALWAVRNIGIATLVTLPVAARALRPAEPAEPAVTPRERENRAPVLLLVLLVLAAVLVVVRGAGEPNFDLEKYPVRTLERLDDRKMLGRRMVTTDAWAGYVIARYWPEQPVFFDDRYDMYPLKIDEAYLKLLSLKHGWEQVLDDYEIDLVVWPRRAGLVEGLKRLPGWRKIAEDDVAVVYERTHPIGAPAIAEKD